MAYLILSILSSTLIFITFKLSERFHSSLVKLIVINYVTASILGFSFYRDPIDVSFICSAPWFSFAVIIGFLFALFFFLIGKSTQLAGISITTIASKMSVAIPVLFSVLFFAEGISILKSTGLIAAFLSVFLCSYKPGKKNTKIKFILPLVIFTGTGISDSLIKYAQQMWVKNDTVLLFSATVFTVAFLAGIIYSLVHEQKINDYADIRLLSGGVLLGMFNFGSLYFFIQALEKSRLDSSVVFGLNNVSIVGLSVLCGYFVFSEKINRINLLGIMLAFASIFILTNI